MDEKRMKHIASVSFGKDSLAMLLILIAEGYPLDEVVFYDTGMEFQAIYDTRDMILPLLHEKGIQYTELQPKEPFLYKMFERPVCKMGTKIIHKYGYSWCGGTCRWGTTDKLKYLNRYAKSLNANVYVGIAADETERAFYKEDWKLFPLIEQDMSESDCLNVCYENGYTWEEDGFHLYELLDRVSCWCCANKNLKELKNIYINLPRYWDQLKELQSKTDRPMKGEGKSVFDLEKRFMKEEAEKC